MKLSVIIPVFNEGETLKKIIGRVLRQRVHEILVIDDGSTDRSRGILKALRNKKIKTILHAKNRGKGAAIRSALRKVSGDFVLIQDADLEYNPEEYKLLLKHASAKNAVYGSRILGNNPHAYERTYLGNVLLTNFCNLLFSTKLTDSYTCYKLLPIKLAKSLKLKSDGFEVEAEITGKLAKKGIKIIEVPISYRPRSYEEGKKIKTPDAIKGLLTFLKIYLS